MGAQRGFRVVRLPCGVDVKPGTATLSRGLAFLTLVFLVARTAAPVRDADTFWHVAAGRQTLADRTFVGPDPLSPFTAGPWIRHQWLPETVFATLQDRLGMGALALALPVMAAATIWILYLVLRQFSGVLLALVLLALAFLTMSGSISLRPQVLSFAGTAGVLGLWLTSGAGGSLRRLWWVVPVTWLWACCHGLWLLSPVIGVGVVVGWAVDRRSTRALGPAALVVVASFVVGLLTPVGPQLLLAPLQVRKVASYIQEWQPAPWSSLPFIALGVLLVLVALGWFAGRRMPPTSHLLLTLLALVLGLSARRTVGIAGISLVVVAAAPLQRFLPRAREAWSGRELAWSGVAAMVGVAAAGVVIWSLPSPLAGYPATAFRQLGSVAKGSAVCVEYETGSWLLWRHPGLVPSVDGRTELYSPAQLELALRFTNGAAGSDELLRQATGCRHALVHTRGAASALLDRRYQRVETNGELSLYDLSAPKGGR